jgi:hypothetical protein
MPHRLGPRASTIVAGVALVGAAGVLAGGVGLAPPVALAGIALAGIALSGIALAGIALSLAASAAAVVLGLRGSRWAFRLVIVAALVDVAMLVLAGSRMVAAL